jgi:hypothetical protein
MTQAVGCRRLTADAHVRTQINPREICVGQSGIGTGFPPEYLGFACQYLSMMLHTHLHVQVTLSWKSFKQECSFGNRRT